MDSHYAAEVFASPRLRRGRPPATLNDDGRGYRDGLAAVGGARGSRSGHGSRSLGPLAQAIVAADAAPAAIVVDDGPAAAVAAENPAYPDDWAADEYIFGEDGFAFGGAEDSDAFEDDFGVLVIGGGWGGGSSSGDSDSDGGDSDGGDSRGDSQGGSQGDGQGDGQDGSQGDGQDGSQGDGKGDSGTKGISTALSRAVLRLQEESGKPENSSASDPRLDLGGDSDGSEDDSGGEEEGCGCGAIGDGVHV